MFLLDIRNLTIELETDEGKIRAVDRVSLSLREGEVRALVGESGSGKSLVAKAIVGVLNQRWTITADRMHLNGVDLLRLSADKRRELISDNIAMIYQDPLKSLDPTSKIAEQLEESIPEKSLNGWFWQKAKQRKEKAHALLHKVGIKDHDAVMNAYPHDLSEGVCQKVMIAMAIARSPKLLIADEPTTALEATTRAQIFRLLKSLNQLKNMSVLMISHDLETLTDWTDSLSVMYCGQLVETGDASAIFDEPLHPYTQALIDSVPEFISNLQPKQPLYALKGSIPTLQHLPIGCRLGPRCPNAQKACVHTPALEKLGVRSVACHFPLNLPTEARFAQLSKGFKL